MFLNPNGGKELAHLCQLILCFFVAQLAFACSVYNVPNQLKEDYLLTTGFSIHGSEKRSRLTVWNTYKLPDSLGSVEDIPFTQVASSEAIDQWSVYLPEEEADSDRSAIQSQLDTATETLASYHLDHSDFRLHFKTYIVPLGISFNLRKTQDLGAITDFDIYVPAAADSASTLHKVIGKVSHEKLHFFAEVDQIAKSLYGDLYQ